MNKKTLLLLIPLLLCGCDNNTSNSTSQELSKDKQLAKLYNTLKSAEGHVNSVDSDITMTTYYYSLPGAVKSVGTIERFNSDEGQIVVQNSRESVNQNANGEFINFFNYEKQTFYDSNYFYQITDFVDASSNKNKKVAFNAEYIDDYLNISFAATERATIQQMIYDFNNASRSVEFTNISDYKENGEWKYSYTYTIFESSTKTVKSSEYICENTITVENGIISKVVQHTEDNLYYGGLKVNWTITDSINIYHQGEYKIFKGTRFNPENYTFA